MASNLLSLNLPTSEKLSLSTIASNVSTSNTTDSISNAASSLGYQFSNTLSTSSSTSSTKSTDPLSNLGFTSEGNVLNDYYNVTYHFIFSMMTDVYDDIKTANKVVIAESGATEMSIISVRATDVLAPNFQTKNTQWSDFVIQIFEPMGTNLYEKLFEAAKVLQVQNIQKCFYNLELYFLGYDSNGNPTKIEGKSWNWPLSIVDVTTQMDASGCKHTLNMIVSFFQAQTDSYNVIPQSFKLDGKTLGDILTSLASNLNQMQLDTYLVPMTTYKFEYLSYPSGTSVVKNPGDLVINLSDYDDTIIRNPDGAHVAEGTTIESLIGSLLSNSETACKLINPGRKPDNIPLDPKNKMPNSIFVSIKSVVKLGTYHPLYADYERVITYTLVPYDVTRLYGNLSNASDISDADYNKRKLKYLIEKKYLKKLYDYIFTGNNTEILNFDIQSNFSYYAIQDYMYGINHTSSNELAQVDNSNIAPVKITNQQNAINDQLKNDKSSIEQRILANKTKQDQITNQKNTVVSLQSQLAKDPNNTALKQTLQTAQNQLTQLTSSIDTTILKDAQSLFNTDYSARKTTEQKLKSSSPVQYVDNFDSSIISATDDFTPVSLRYDRNWSDKTAQYNVDSYPDNRRSMFMSMLQQLYEPTGSALTNVKLTIRGDPYWLGGAFMGTNYNSNDIATAINDSYNLSSGSPGIADYPVAFLNETSFCLRFNAPSGYSDSTGNVIIKKGGYFSGFYTCISVEHEFSNGEYKQILDGNLIPGSSYDKIVGS